MRKCEPEAEGEGDRDRAKEKESESMSRLGENQGQLERIMQLIQKCVVCRVPPHIVIV